MTKMIVGYFQWRRNTQGQARPCKQLKDHHDWLIASANHQDKARHYDNLINEIPLDEEAWKLSLESLATSYPCTEPDKVSRHKPRAPELSSQLLTREAKKLHLQTSYRMTKDQVEEQLEKLGYGASASS